MICIGSAFSRMGYDRGRDKNCKYVFKFIARSVTTDLLSQVIKT